MENLMIYLDHAATSYPKSPDVGLAMTRFLESGGNPGRSGHALAQWAEEEIWRSREVTAELVGASHPSQIVFSLNATASLNAAIHHLTTVGGRVITSAFEHNSVARPVHRAASSGVITHTVIGRTPDAPLDLAALRRELHRGDVSGVVIAHASNVTGAILPLSEIASLCQSFGALLVVDAAQTCGHMRVRADDVDVLVFAGHKGAGGPAGVGGMAIREGLQLEPYVTGGSGGKSESLDQPRWLPWAQEAGTLTGPGIAGFRAAIATVSAAELDDRRSRIHQLRQRLVAGLTLLDRIDLHEVPSRAGHVGVLSFTVDGIPPTTVAALLEERYQIMVRAGLHCAPLAHQTLGTFPTGTVRISVSHETDESHVDALISAVSEIGSE
jgi:cysteine desulfurase/selenocysteine lyase